jgi:hypothetical protein
MKRHFNRRLDVSWWAENGDEEFQQWLGNRPQLDAKASEYSKLFEIFEPTERRRAQYIEQLVSQGRPGFDYFCLSQLLSGDYINTVITTNFDDLLYDACALWSDKRPRVYAYGTTNSAPRIENGRTTILKLHGDFLYSKLKNIDGEVALIDANMETSVRRLMDDHELIVIGYAGNDESIMELLNDIPKDAGLYWCVYGDRPVSDAAELVLKKKSVYRVRTDGFESAMDELLHAIGFTLPEMGKSVKEQRAE